SAPAPAKPKTQPARPKPANVAGPASGSAARNNVSE
ncbi:penicillin-binding protein 2, partial [Cupriavidus sp. HMR-1]